MVFGPITVKKSNFQKTLQNHKTLLLLVPSAIWQVLQGSITSGKAGKIKKRQIIELTVTLKLREVEQF